MTRYTVVQHSAMGYKGDTSFQKALEVRTLTTVKEQQHVLRAGGKLFDSWNEADDYTDSVGLNAPGTFSKDTVDELKIYLAPKQ